MNVDMEKIVKAAQQGSIVVNLLVPAISQLFTFALSIAQQAKQRGWEVDTSSLLETAAKFDTIANIAREERAKYEGK